MTYHTVRFLVARSGLSKLKNELTESNELSKSKQEYNYKSMVIYKTHNNNAKNHISIISAF